ncbi:MAG: hypothetical protein QF613_07635 [Candidatus Marinimicrobia bacterium]|nr:hypothetical protein [Candidatus Neomarinimicrobiota bacterium]
MMRRIYSIAGLLLFALLVAACASSSGAHKSELDASDQKKSEKVNSVFLENSIMNFHYVERRSNSKNLLVFIHGTPGSWDIFSPQLNSDSLASTASMVAIDCPGWGQSTKSVKSASPGSGGLAACSPGTRYHGMLPLWCRIQEFW